MRVAVGTSPLTEYERVETGIGHRQGRYVQYGRPGGRHQTKPQEKSTRTRRLHRIRRRTRVDDFRIYHHESRAHPRQAQLRLRARDCRRGQGARRRRCPHRRRRATQRSPTRPSRLRARDCRRGQGARRRRCPHRRQRATQRSPTRPSRLRARDCRRGQGARRRRCPHRRRRATQRSAARPGRSFSRVNRRRILSDGLRCSFIRVAKFDPIKRPNWTLRPAFSSCPSSRGRRRRGERRPLIGPGFELPSLDDTLRAIRPSTCVGGFFFAPVEAKVVGDFDAVAADERLGLARRCDRLGAVNADTPHAQGVSS